MAGTESPSSHDNLEKLSIRELLEGMNGEDSTVPVAIWSALPAIEKLIAAVVEKLREGGRLFYIGAGSSGRLGVLDASEIPPTYGVPQGKVIALIAGGDKAIRQAVENAEDDRAQAWKDLSVHAISKNDFLIGIAASGRTPYVLGALEDAKRNGVMTGCIACNPGTELAGIADLPIEVSVGAEFVTGSTRMKSGTAQKLILNMISTAAMIRLGHVKGNKMIDMALTNSKLVGRGARMIMDELGVNHDEAEAMLKKYGSVRKAIEKKK